MSQQQSLVEGQRHLMLPGQHITVVTNGAGGEREGTLRTIMGYSVQGQPQLRSLLCGVTPHRMPRGWLNISNMLRILCGKCQKIVAPTCV